ncbi:MAG: ABC transporter permease [Planctomycetota bacterium]
MSTTIVDAKPAPRVGRLSRAVAWLERLADRFNPILVKETRQALKSRQFLITFTLVLICAWLWTIIGVLWAGDDIYRWRAGPDLFAGYFMILSFPLWVIVPFSTFRSLASEREDRTYELLAITTLGPRQIVSGKLTSAAMQMLVYLSSITPCLAFTYMLRGLDFPTILLMVGYAVLISMGLSLLSLLVASLSTERHWQAVLMVAVVAGLIFAFFGFFSGGMAIVSEGAIPYTEPEFWQFIAGLLSAYVGYFLLFYYAAAAQLTFASDNRSTVLRVVMVGQQLVFTGWFVWMWTRFNLSRELEVLVGYFTLVGLHWYILGAMMVGESPDLSPRVKRGLPKSHLGRMFLTWFNPGPGTAYVFAISGYVAAMLVAIAVWAMSAVATPGPMSPEVWHCFGYATLAFSYLVLLLGLEMLVIRWWRMVASVPQGLPPLLQCLMLLGGTLAAQVVRGSMRGQLPDFMVSDVLNPFWTLAYIGDYRGGNVVEWPAILLLVGVPALLVFLLNLGAVAREVIQVRMEAPKRVREEEAQLEAERHPPKPRQISPWDVVEA